MSDMKHIIEDSFTNYAGAVLQSRALVDVRDCIKPSARQIFYSMLLNKLTYNKPFKKTNNAIGMAMADFYIHGDSSAEGIIMRAAQPFALRYPFIEVEGSYGDIRMSGNWAAPRYTASRLSPLSSVLFEDINKDTIAEWRDNYDDTKQYPAVLPSKGFYGICNGTQGIGVGAASSIPQYNLKELNEALIKLLWNPDISFDEIYCEPDFATGAILLNAEEVKESHKYGCGAACKLRSVVEYDQKDRCFIVTQIPYSVYTSTIRDELNAIISSEDNPGIERYNDLTKGTPLIKIYLEKKANPNKILKYLYKNTSLQSFYGINFTMLKDGKYPKVFGWKEALQEHINHEIEVYTRGFKFDLNKIETRLHIIDGLMVALANIDEVVKIIKTSDSTVIASQNLQKQFLLDEAQTKSILDMKLSRLAKLEVSKLEKEKQELEIEKNRLVEILNNDELLKKEIENGFRAVANKFGDERRTKILNIEGEDSEPAEIKTLTVNLTNKNNVIVIEQSSLFTQRRGGVGSKFKLDKGERVICSTSCENIDTILLFTKKGNYYGCDIQKIPYEEKVAIEQFLTPQPNEEFCAITSLAKKNPKKYIVFITNGGMLKKSLITEYNTKRAGGTKALNLSKDDKICSIVFANDNDVLGMLSSDGNFLMCSLDDIRPVGRVAAGIKGMKLNDGYCVVSANIISKDTKEIITCTKNGYAKRTLKSDFIIQQTNTKGKRIQKLKDNNDVVVDFLPLKETDTEISVCSSLSQLRTKLSEIPLLTTGTLGNKIMKLSETSKIISLGMV